MKANKPRSQWFSWELHFNAEKAGCLQGDGEIFFFVGSGQGVKRDFEGSQCDIWGAAHQFKIDRMLTLCAFGKKLVTQEGDFVGKPMVAVEDAINATFRNFVTAAKSSFCFRLADARIYETKFSLCRTHVLAQPNRLIGCC
jgi:hypothetical protein